jgi:hypothetical protein
MGNIASDSWLNRDLLIKKGAISALINFIQNIKSENVVESHLWALSNFCRGERLPKY